MSHPTPRSDQAPPSNHTLLWLAGIVLIIPLIAIAAVPTYARKGPELAGFPFFIWYQLLWVFITAACTMTAHALVKRARAGSATTPKAES